MIQIAAYRGKSLVSRLIEWQTRSDFSHIAVLFTEDLSVTVDGKTTMIRAGNVIEAWQDGGVLLNESLGTKHTGHTSVDLFDFVTPLTLAEEKEMAGFLLRQLGKPYDYRSVVRFITRADQSPWDREKWFCSELAYAACILANRRLFARTEPWRVNPDWMTRSTLLEFNRTVVTPWLASDRAF